jgi:hypothetical protein
MRCDENLRVKAYERAYRDRQFTDESEFAGISSPTPCITDDSDGPGSSARPKMEAAPVPQKATAMSAEPDDLSAAETCARMRVPDRNFT